jgi:hypothetical protein
MRFSTSRLGLLVGALIAALALTACGGGSGDGGDKAPAKDSPPSKADFKEAKKALADLKADYQAVYDAGAKVQKTSVTYFRSHPDGTADDPVFKPVTTAFDEAVKKRDDTRDKVDGLKALKDEDVSKAYETFSTKAEKGDQYYDSLYAAFPLLEQSFAACGDVFTSTKLDTSPSSPAEFGRRILAQYKKAIADCLPVLDKMSSSENANLAAFASGFTKVVTDRRTLMTRLSTDHISMPAFSSQYKQVAARAKKVSENLDVQKQLNALTPVPEFLAMEKVVARKAG